MNFKVGDIVRGILGNRYACTGKDMTKGEVVFVNQDKYISVKILEHNHPEKLCCDIGHIHVGLVPTSFEFVTDKPHICEILGVEVGEKFGLEYGSSCVREPRYFIDDTGTFKVQQDGGRIDDFEDVCDVINHPEKIIRQPQFSDQEIVGLKALVMFEFPYLARDEDNGIWGFSIIPYKRDCDWASGESAVTLPETLFPQIKWTDAEPFYIVGYLEGLK